MDIESLTNKLPDNRSFLQSDLIPSSSMVGVEIELEGLHHYGISGFKNKYWEVKNDGSLRNNGHEFVFRNPLSGVDIENALSEFDKYIRDYTKRYGPPEASERCSIHVHVDMRDATIKQSHIFVLLFLTFERMFFHEFGGNRGENNYCLPIGETGARRNLAMLGSSSMGKVADSLQGSKYTSLNTGAVYNFGSFEVRLHEGTYDVNRIFKWVCILLSMREYSKTFDVNPLQYPSIVSEIGLNDFVSNVFDHYMDDHLYKGWQTDLMRGMRQAQDVIIYEKIKANHNKITKKAGEISNLFKSYAKKNSLIIDVDEPEGEEVMEDDE